MPNKAIEKAKAGIKKPISKVKGKIKSNPNTKWVLIGGAVVLAAAGGVGFWYYRKNKKEKSLGLTTTKSSTSSISTTRTTSRPASSSVRMFSAEWCATHKGFPIKYGSCGEHVETLQKYLLHIKKQNLGDYGVKGVDGLFGNTTKEKAQSALGKTVFSESDINSYKNSLKLIGK